MWNQTQKPPLFTERELVMMATTNAAALVNLSAQLGSLATGHAADLIVIKKTAAGHDAFWTLTHSTPADLQLVVIGGSAMYGDTALMQTFGTNGEPLQVCGAAKSLAVPGKPFAETQRVLDHALQQQDRKLAPLAECGQ
jgi:5-methylthioadenosine/S-adenosylhomocysteine deaminase